MKPLRYLFLSVALCGFAAFELASAHAAYPTPVNDQITDSAVQVPQPKKNQKPQSKTQHNCPEGKNYCCTGQNDEGFDQCGCYTATECVPE